MTKQELFELYGRVQKRDRKAEDILIQEHKSKYPNNWFHKGNFTRATDPNYRGTLHMMYLHLTR